MLRYLLGKVLCRLVLPATQEPRLAAGWDGRTVPVSPEPGFHLRLDHDLITTCSIRLGGRKT